MPLLFVLLIIALIAPIRVSSHSTTNHVIISELQHWGATSTDEFVELYNPTDCPIVIDGWKLTRKTSSGNKYNLVTALSGTIPAHGFFLIAHQNGYINSVTPDVRYSGSTFNFAPNNTVLLYADQTETLLIDKVGFGAATDFEGSPAQNPAPAQSIARVNNQDTDNNAVDFQVQTIPSPQNTQSPPDQPPGTCTAPPPAPPAPPPTPPSAPPSGDTAGANIISISEARQAVSGTRLTTSGTVTAAPGQLSSTYFYIEDGSSGIQVYSSKKLFPQLTIGDAVQVNGTASEAYRERRLKIDDKTSITRTGQGSIVPRLRKTGQINEDVEGRLIRLSGSVTKTSGNTFHINDGSGDARIYIKSETGIDKPEMATGDSVTIVGIVSQYNDTYRVMPRLQSDVKVADTDVESDQGSDSETDSDTASGAEDSSEGEAEIAGVTFTSPVAKTLVITDRPLWVRVAAYAAISLGVILILLVPLLLWIKKKHGSLALPWKRENSSTHSPRS